MKRDPELARKLEAALPAGIPLSGAEERVLQRIRQRQSSEQTGAGAARNATRSWGLAVGATLLVCGATLVTLFGGELGGRVSGAPGGAREAAPGVDGDDAQGSARERVISVGGVRLLARAGTVLDLDAAARLGECRLLSGEILVHVAEGGAEPFAVVTPTARAVVTGTVFAVRAAPSGETSVTVWEGGVDVVRAGERRQLRAGQHWPEGTQRLLASRGDFARVGALDRVVARAATPATAAADAGAPRDAPTRASSPTSRAAPLRESRPIGEPLPTKRGVAPTASLGDELYRQARAAEASGHRRRAAALYERAAEQTHGPAEAALFAAARLYGGALAEYIRARGLLRTYRARYPDGVYGRAADVLLLRSLVALEDGASVEREAARFLQRYSDDPRAPQFRWERAAARARRGRCAEARLDLPELDLALARRLERMCPARITPADAPEAADPRSSDTAPRR